MTTQTASYLDAIEHMPAGSTLILTEVPWDEYEWLLADLGDEYAVRVNYDRGRLEIMSPSPKHEEYKELILIIANTLAVEMECNLESFGSATFKQGRLDRSAEPDTCFYVQHAESMTGKDLIDLSLDPPPDVVVEVDFTSSSVTKFPLCASIGVPEIWRYDGRCLEFYGLTEQGYVSVFASSAFPVLTSDTLLQFLEQAKTRPRVVILQSFREWAQKQRRPGV